MQFEFRLNIKTESERKIVKTRSTAANTTNYISEETAASFVVVKNQLNTKDRNQITESLSQVEKDKIKLPL